MAIVNDRSMHARHGCCDQQQRTLHEEKQKNHGYCVELPATVEQLEKRDNVLKEEGDSTRGKLMEMSSTPPPRRRSVSGLRLRMIQASLRKRRTSSRCDDDDDDHDDDFSTTLTPLLEKEIRPPSRPGCYSQVRLQPLSLIDGSPHNPGSSILLSLPLTLGRVNLSTWWWNSCPVCSSGGSSPQPARRRKKWKHPAPTVFCSTHCQPVAKQVLALSKAMMTLSARGQVEIVGRKPNLVHIQDQSGQRQGQGQSSSLCKIVSIGEEKRRPWMKFHLELIPQGTAVCKENPANEVSVAKTATSSGYLREQTAARDNAANQTKKATTGQQQHHQHHQQEQEQTQLSPAAPSAPCHHQPRRRDRDTPKKLAPLPSSPASVQSPRSSQWITPTTTNTTRTTAAPNCSRKRPRALQFSDEEGGTPKKHHLTTRDGPRTQDIPYETSQCTAQEDGNARNFKARHDDPYEETAIFSAPGNSQRNDNEGSATLSSHGNSQEPATPAGNGTATALRNRGTKATNDGPPNTILPLPKSSFVFPDQSESQSSPSTMPGSSRLVCESQPFQRPHETHARRKGRKLDGMKDNTDSVTMKDNNDAATSQSAASSSGSSSVLSLGSFEKPPSTQGSIVVGGTQHEHREQTQVWERLKKAATSKATSALLDLVKERNTHTDVFWLPTLLDDCKEEVASYHMGFPP